MTVTEMVIKMCAGFKFLGRRLFVSWSVSSIPGETVGGREGGGQRKDSKVGKWPLPV